MSRTHQLRRALALLAGVIVAGTVGYLALGFGLLDALYQTVTTVATVGFREVRPLNAAGKVFTMVLILVGVGATLYALGVFFETLLEGRLLDLLGRRRMERSIESLEGHVIICGWGRVGRSIADELVEAGRPFVVIDLDAERLADRDVLGVHGDATEDSVLEAAGVGRASALVAAVDADAANSFITLSARALRPDLFIVSRARSLDSEDKLRRAGADRVVNPQHIGGSRMAAFVLRPQVAEFLDVVMHERTLEFRLEEFTVGPASRVAGRSLREARLREDTGALVLAVRQPGGSLSTNPPPDTALTPGLVLIAIGTGDELRGLGAVVAPG